MSRWSQRRERHVRQETTKMSVGWYYSGCCCPDCMDRVPYRRSWRRRMRQRIANSKDKTLRTHRIGK